jgi:comEA protein
MNARPLPVPERGLILLVAIALMASGVILYVGQERPPAVLRSKPIVLENVLVVQPTFHDARTLDLNTATIEELVRLPGIGPVLGERIISFRTENGRFTSVDELLAVRGIGPKVLEEIRGQVTIGAEEERAPDNQ